MRLSPTWRHAYIRRIKRKTLSKALPVARQDYTGARFFTVLASLDQTMVAKINSGDLEKIWLAVPEILNWEEIDGFTYRVPSTNPEETRPSAVHPDIDLKRLDVRN